MQQYDSNLQESLAFVSSAHSPVFLKVLGTNEMFVGKYETSLSVLFGQ